ncbi:MAG: 4Fe-4S binding protein [Firmicutes bacterium]|nr:4Fe-4S binding protein [Bacillota bacterium]
MVKTIKVKRGGVNMAARVLPVVPSAKAGTMAAKSAAPVWREKRPQLMDGRCNRCGDCLFFCPDGALGIEEGQLTINLEFCKGCGICTHECQLEAIIMVPEHRVESGLLG